MNLFHWAGPPEVWRVHFHTDPDADEAALLSAENCEAMMARFLPAGPYDIRGARLFVIHQRVATAFRKGRAVLAGDAAHVNSPIGAMGMNSGVHDAMNLGGKLAAIFGVVPTTPFLIATSANVALSRLNTSKRRPSATRSCWRN